MECSLKDKYEACVKLELFTNIPDPRRKNFMLVYCSSLARSEHVTSTSWLETVTVVQLKRRAIEAVSHYDSIGRFLNLRLEVK
jgi:hypothetical protein